MVPRLGNPRSTNPVSPDITYPNLFDCFSHPTYSTKTIGFRALVEENVKAQVAKIARSSIVLNAYQKFEEAEAAKGANSSSTETNNAIVTPSHNEKKRSEEEAEPIAIFIHGWV